jgi:hypothetical protein
MAHLASAGVSSTDDLKVELGLETRGYQRVRRTLESRGAVLSRTISVELPGGGHRHMSELMRWDQMVDDSSGNADEALVEILGAVVDAAVLIPEGEASRALTWTISKDVLERSIHDGRILQLSKGMLATSKT